VPSTGKIYNSTDVYFDEDFNSTLAYETNKFSGHLEITVTDPLPDTDLPVHHTGNPFMFAKKCPSGHTQFAQPYVTEMYDEDLAEPQFDGEPTLDQIIESKTITLNCKYNLWKMTNHAGWQHHT
jgi:hypothetical protein